MPSNLLYIFSDQHNRAMTGCYGHPLDVTPHLDGLAARGTRFANAYTNSPICMPGHRPLRAPDRRLGQCPRVRGGAGELAPSAASAGTPRRLNRQAPLQGGGRSRIQRRALPPASPGSGRRSFLRPGRDGAAIAAHRLRRSRPGRFILFAIRSSQCRARLPMVVRALVRGGRQALGPVPGHRQPPYAIHLTAGALPALRCHLGAAAADLARRGLAAPSRPRLSAGASQSRRTIPRGGRAQGECHVSGSLRLRRRAGRPDPGGSGGQRTGGGHDGRLHHRSR